MNHFGNVGTMLFKVCLTLGLMTATHTITIAQYNPEAFGKHNIQYKKLDWKYYDATNFKIYHYDRAGRELARYVVEQVERDVAAIEKRLSGLFPQKINIILYNCFDDYEQSNIGLVRSSQFRNINVAGKMEVVGDKIAVYFDGNHHNLKEQLRLGMARIVMERMLFGEKLREIVKNMVMLDMPKWSTDGYVDYIVSGWTAIDDNEWKNIVNHPQTSDKTFLSLSEKYPRLVGKAIYKYIETEFGENSIRNLLYMTQAKSGLNTAMKLTFGKDLKNFYIQTLQFYKKHYENEKLKYESPVFDEKLGSIAAANYDERISQVYVSPKGKDIAYVKYKNGEYKVVLEKTNLKEDERVKSTIMHAGVLNYEDGGDPDYPKVAWSNTGFKLGILYKEKNQIFIKVYDANKTKVQLHKIPKNKIDRITGFTFMEDDEFIVFSGIKGGQSDIYELYLKRKRLTPITQDVWDDADPVFVSGGARKGIVFLSNRPTSKINVSAMPNELPTGSMKAYFYNSTTKSYDLLPLTANFEGEIKDVIPYGMDNFSFLSDISGISNRYVVMFGRDGNNMDSAYVIPVTNYNNSILFQQYHPSGQNIVEVIQEQDKIEVYFRKAELPAPWGDLQSKDVIVNSFVENKLANTYIQHSDTINAGKRKEYFAKSEDLFDQKSHVAISVGNDFQTDFSAVDLPQLTVKKMEADADAFAEKLNIKSNEAIVKFEKPTFYDPVNRAYITDTSVIFVDSTFMRLRSNPARSSVNIDYLGLNLDNSVLFNKYQSYLHNMAEYRNAPLSFLLSGSLFDKFENHRIVAGARINANLNGLNYYAQYENLKGRNDWGFTYYSFYNSLVHTFLIGNSDLYEIPGRSGSHILQFDFSRPLDKTKALKFNLAYRQNYMHLRAQELVGLIIPNLKDQWINWHGEFSYDNTSNPLYNIWRGMRAKIYADFMYKFKDDNDGLGFHAYQYEKTSYVYNVGFDVRNYIPIYRTSIFAVRASGAHAAGSQQIVYYMGGVDNDFSPKWDNSSIKPSQTQNYAYQALATNMRGYDRNYTNGNTFALLNAEYRVPVMSTILNRDTKSSILKSLQLVAFIDVGSAWEGLFATGDRAGKRFSSYVWPASPQKPIVTINMPGTKNGSLAASSGIGVRAKLLGYFLKVDGTYNLDKDFGYHISIGTDF